MAAKTHIATDELRALSAALDQATTNDAVLQAALSFVRKKTRFRRLWLYLIDQSDQTVAHFAGGAGELGPGVDYPPNVPLSGDEYLAEVTGGRGPVVVLDARTDPRVNTEIAGALNNRTVINIPLVLVDRTTGCLGTGTFGDEGPCPPTDDELAALEVVGTYVSIAADRNRLLSERLAAERALQAAQRQELTARMLAGVAHDFNNALTVISGQAAVLRRTQDPESFEHGLVSISAAVDLAAGLVRRIQGRYQDSAPAPSTVDAASVVRDLAGLSRSLLVAEVAFVARLPTMPLLVRCDRLSLEQIYLNLLVNARDALHGPGRIEVALEEQDRSVCLSVQDDGCGMSEELVGRIHEAFFTTKAEGAGTGLGLYVVDRLVSEMGGRLGITSAPGVGTTVQVELPV